MSLGPACPPRGRGAGRSEPEENGLFATRGARPPGLGPGFAPAPGFGPPAAGPGFAPGPGFGPTAAGLGFAPAPGLGAVAPGRGPPGLGAFSPGLTLLVGVEAALATAGFTPGLGPGFAAPAPGLGPGFAPVFFGAGSLFVGVDPAGVLVGTGPLACVASPPDLEPEPSTP